MFGNNKKMKMLNEKLSQIKSEQQELLKIREI